MKLFWISYRGVVNECFKLLCGIFFSFVLMLDYWYNYKNLTVLQLCTFVISRKGRKHITQQILSKIRLNKEISWLIFSPILSLYRKIPVIKDIQIFELISRKSSAVCIFAVLCSVSVCCSNEIVFSAWFYFLLEPTKEEKKS